MIADRETLQKVMDFPYNWSISKNPVRVTHSRQKLGISKWELYIVLIDAEKTILKILG